MSSVKDVIFLPNFVILWRIYLRSREYGVRGISNLLGPEVIVKDHWPLKRHSIAETSLRRAKNRPEWTLNHFKPTRTTRNGFCKVNLKSILKYAVFILLLMFLQSISFKNYFALVSIFLWYLLPFNNVGSYNSFLLFSYACFLADQ